MGTRQVGSTRLLAIFGSGETTSGMTSVHQDLIRRAGGTRTNGIMLDTPFGFQENADEIAARAVAYFRDHVGSDIRVASFRRKPNELGYERFIDEISRATYIFAGPGSPTYALKLWRDGEIRRRLAEKLVFGGCLAFSSAAAAGLGAYAIPVYEIYKVGEDPFWVDGLDLLGELGIRCVVVPHFNNSEGGTHDTRFCYIGENRLRLLESQLPEDISILGVDEHTVCIIDADHGTVTVRGRGALTLRQRGTERKWRATSLPLSEIQHGLAAEGAVGESGSSKRASVDRNDAEAELTPDAGDVRERLAPLVDMLLDLRNEARNQRRFDEADRLRAVLSASGVEVQDSPTGTAWSLAQA
jgi:cyanophycinase-like exopeptidase